MKKGNDCKVEGVLWGPRLVLNILADNDTPVFSTWEAFGTPVKILPGTRLRTVSLCHPGAPRRCRLVFKKPALATFSKSESPSPETVENNPCISFSSGSVIRLRDLPLGIEIQLEIDSHRS